MKTVTFKGVTYTQAPEEKCGTCKGCVGMPATEEGDVICDRLIIESGNDCENAIWKEESK